MKFVLALAAGVVLVTMPAAALAQGQGNGQGQGRGQGQGQGQGRGQGQGQSASNPPSRNDLPTPVFAQSAAGATAGVTPFAWIDDASLLDPRTVSVALSIARWSGSGMSEVDAPVVDVAIGVTRRVHVTATVPRVVGSDDPFGAAGGAGTSYIGAKVALVDPTKHRFKLAVSPMLEVLGHGVVDPSGEGQRRVHVGVPVSMEIARGPARLFGGTGFFSRGVWFAGAGAGLRAADKWFLSTGFNRAWRTSDALDAALSSRARTEVTGGAAFAAAPNVSLFGAVGRTIKTLDENGAGRTISGGVVFSFAPVVK